MPKPKKKPFLQSAWEKALEKLGPVEKKELIKGMTQQHLSAAAEKLMKDAMEMKPIPLDALPISVTHTAVIDRFNDLGLLEHTTPEDRRNCTQALLNGHVMVIRRCVCGQCKPPEHFTCYAVVPPSL